MKQTTPALWRAIQHTLALHKMESAHELRERLIATGAKHSFTEEDLVEAQVLNPREKAKGEDPGLKVHVGRVRK